MKDWLDWVFSFTPFLKSGDQTQSFNERLDFFRTFVKSGSLCVDIGAHGGQRIEILAALNARVIALEPNPYFFNKLKRQFKRYPNVTLLPIGAGSRNCRTQFYIHKDAQKAGTFSRDLMDAWGELEPKAQTGWQEISNVELTTLDSLFDRYGTPEFVCIDVQGYESEVLRGLSRDIRCVSFSVAPHHRQDALQVMDRLGKIGSYRFNYTFNEVNGLGQRNWIDDQDMMRKFREFSVLDLPSYEVFALRSNIFSKPKLKNRRRP
jgi:FkbM family methyltransferase